MEFARHGTLEDQHLLSAAKLARAMNQVLEAIKYLQTRHLTRDVSNGKIEIFSEDGSRAEVPDAR